MFTSTPKTFIIEDDPAYSKMLEKRLEDRGLSNIYVFESGESGLAALHRKPEFVILDFSLQGLNGLDTLREIKKRLPKTEVIVLTGLRNEKLSGECLPSGASDYLEKEEDSLVTILARLDDIKRRKRKRMWIRIVVVVAVVVLSSALIIAISQGQLL